MPTIKELKEELAAPTEKVNALEVKQDLPDILRKPKFNEKYWCIDSRGDICQMTWDNHPIGDLRWDIGNVFRTKEAAEYALAKLKAETKLKRLAAQAEKFDVLQAMRNGVVLMDEKGRRWVYDSAHGYCHRESCSTVRRMTWHDLAYSTWQPFKEPSMPEPEDGKWYWVQEEGKEPFPAYLEGVFRNVDGTAFDQDLYKVKRHPNGQPIEAVMAKEE